MSSTTAQVGNLRITTQVVNASDGAALSVPQFNTVFTPITSKYFKKIPVKALSAVLMLIGILQLLIGFVFYAAEHKMVSLTLISGVYIWGGVVVFAAGCACLVAMLKDSINAIKVCMSCNITNIVVAAVGLIIFAIQTYYETQACWIELARADSSKCPSDPDTQYDYNYYSYSTISKTIVQLRVSLNIVMILFSLLGLVISCFMTGVSDKELKNSGYNLLR